MAEKPWNILWISLEDTSPRFGCTGDPVARTPNLDRLAAAGCRWPKAFSVAGVCAPSRSAVITGMYPTSIGSHHMRTAHPGPPGSNLPTPYETVPPPHVKCFPEYLRAAGYYCTNAYKCDYQFEPPKTAWDECLTPRAHWRSRPDEDQPFFAVFNFSQTHESGMWPKPDESIRTDPAKVELPPYVPDTPETRIALARHYDNIAAADIFVGERLAELEADGLADNTVVFIWSDHGEGLPRKKRWPNEGGTLVPLIVRWPGQIEPGSLCQDLVSMIDLGPTVMGIAGLTPPAHLQGQAFIGPAATKPARQYVYASRDRYDASYDMMRSLRDSRYRYIRNYYPQQPYLIWIPYRNKHAGIQALWDGFRAGTLTEPQAAFMARSRPAEELYDLDADPHELTNLAAEPEHAETLGRLSGALDDWMLRIGDLGHVPESQMVQGWWPGGVQPTTDAPFFMPYHSQDCGQAPTTGGTFHGPVDIEFYCATQGASMAYTFSEEPEPDWQLYTGPVRLPAGASTLRAKAVRIGYKDSHEITGRFVVTED